MPDARYNLVGTHIILQLYLDAQIIKNEYYFISYSAGYLILLVPCGNTNM